jgi:hypothetical protein
LSGPYYTKSGGGTKGSGTFRGEYVVSYTYVVGDWVVPTRAYATAAAKGLNLSQGNIWTVINGGRNTCGGYKWVLKTI